MSNHHKEVERFYADNMFHGYVEGMNMNADSVILDLGTYKGYTTKLLSDLYKMIIRTGEFSVTLFNKLNRNMIMYTVYQFTCNIHYIIILVI